MLVNKTAGLVAKLVPPHAMAAVIRIADSQTVALAPIGLQDVIKFDHVSALGGTWEEKTFSSQEEWDEYMKK